MKPISLSKVSAGIFSVLMERATNTRNRREREEKKKVIENLFQHRENRLKRKRMYVNIGGRERRTEKIDRETRKREKSVKGWNH
jgi:shikimate kinase